METSSIPKKIARFNWCDKRFYPYIEKVLMRLPKEICFGQILGDLGFDIISFGGDWNGCFRLLHSQIDKLVILNETLLSKPEYEIIHTIVHEIAHKIIGRGETGLYEKEAEDLLVKWGFQQESQKVAYSRPELENEGYKIGYEWAKRQSNLSRFEEFKVNQNQLTSNSWNFAPEPIRVLYEKIDANHQRLAHFLIGGQGMQTGRNEVFAMPTSELRKLTASSKWSRKRARNSDIQRWLILDSGESLLWVEECESLDDTPEKIQEYLRKNANALRRRAAYRRGNCEWWKFTWPLHKELYSEEKIVSPFLSDKNRFALDSEKDFVGLTDTIALFKRPEAQEDIRYFLGLLNSRLLTFRFRGIAKLKGGGIYEYFENSVAKLPIRKIDFSKAQDKQRHDQIVRIVNSLSVLASKLQHAGSETKKRMIERAIRSAEHHLDTIVYQLYGISKSDAAMISESC